MGAGTSVSPMRTSAWTTRIGVGEEVVGPPKVTVAYESDPGGGLVALAGVVRIQLGRGGTSAVASCSDGDLAVGTTGFEHDTLEAVVLDDSEAAGAHLLGGVFEELQEEPLHGIDPHTQRLRAAQRTLSAPPRSRAVSV